MERSALARLLALAALAAAWLGPSAPAEGAGGRRKAPRKAAAAKKAGAEEAGAKKANGKDAPPQVEGSEGVEAPPQAEAGARTGDGSEPAPGAGKQGGAGAPPEGAVGEAAGAGTPADAAGGPTGDRGEAPSRAEASGIDPALARALEREGEALQDAIFQSRSRIAAATRHLEPAAVAIGLRTNLPRFYSVENVVLTLDGAPILVRDAGLPAAVDPLAEVRASPGVHRLGIAMDLTARRNPETRMSVRHVVTFEIPEGRDVRVRLVLRELGNLWRAGKKGRGTSRWLAFVRVRSRKRKDGRGTGRRRAGKGRGVSVRTKTSATAAAKGGKK